MIIMLSIEENKKRRELWRQKYTDAQIAEKCGVSRAAIYSWRKKYNLKSNGRGRGNYLNESEELLRQNLFEKGHTDEEIADILNISTITVFNWRIKNGLYRTRQGNEERYQDLTDEERVFYEYLKDKHNDLRETTLLALAKFVEPRSDLSPAANLRRFAKKIKAPGFKTVFYFDDGELNYIKEAVELFVQINKRDISNSSKQRLINSIPNEYYSLVCEEMNRQLNL